ncbi:MAG TPA: alpha-L-arabinofuranosidase C-terminal domain-containing protein [Armatimonadota bacterium]|nr:alpha-L-arabinofuranosidase C-terminal domain-containing protein [Armatimonadota bacterium]
MCTTKRFFFLLCSLIAVCSLLCSAQTATISVNAKRVIGNVKPFIFGHNVEASDSYGTFSNTHSYGAVRAEGLWDAEKNQLAPEMVAMSKEIGVKVMRYPGGCLTHNFDWHLAVGPIDQRPNYPFGVNEFIAYCQAVGAEPLMNVSEYVGTPQDAADLVEYLNAPADAQHPWAQKRAQWGHPEPFHVRYFEMGNESDHGNHSAVPHKQYTGKEYAEWVIASAKLMRKIDSSIKIGALMGTGTSAFDPWNSTVLSMTKGLVDFIIVHTYAVGCNEETAQKTPPERLMRSCMTASKQFETKLAEYRGVIKKYSGKNLPMAITEYNASFVQEKPEPYRYSYGAALFSADYVRVLLQPDSNVFMANYWHLGNGYWGMIQGYGPYKKMPAYYLYRLWAQHFGSKLVAVKTEAPSILVDGTPITPAMLAAKPNIKITGKNLFDPTAISTIHGPGYSIETKADGTMVAKFDHFEQELYPDLAKIDAPWTGAGYDISFEARATGNFPNCQIGLGLNDMRGWSTTSSALAIEGLQTTNKWTKFSGRFNTLFDCQGIIPLWRLRAKKGSSLTGTVEIRNLRIVACKAASVSGCETLTAAASKSADGKTLYLIVFNKDLAKDIPVQIRLQGLRQVTSVRRWLVNGPNLAALNFEKENVREVESGVAMALPQDGLLTYTAPAHSMTAIEIQ